MNVMGSGSGWKGELKWERRWEVKREIEIEWEGRGKGTGKDRTIKSFVNIAHFSNKVTVSYLNCNS
jgi:hypothetical protein